MIKNLKIFKFVEQVKQEVTKVHWPARKELVLSAITVFASVVVISFACLIVDYGVHNSVQFLLNFGKS